MAKPSLIRAVGLCLLLAACGAKTDGVEIANVNGQAITTADLEAEAGVNRDPAQDQAALERMIDRKVMAQASDKAKLTEVVDADTAKTIDELKAQAYIRTVAKRMLEPTETDVAEFIAAHPEAFSGRKFLVVDQIEFQARDNPPSRPDRTLEDVETYLKARSAPYQRMVVVIDTASARPETVRQILALPADAVYEVRNGQNLVDGRVLQVHDRPLTGAYATQMAQNLMRNERTAAAVREGRDALRARAKITYGPGYEPKAAEAKAAEPKATPAAK